MNYEDFSINEKAIEKMAREFASAKIMQNDQTEVDERDFSQSLIYDIFSGFKILERALFAAKNQTKNLRLLNFIYNSQTPMEHALQELLKIKNDIIINDLDFELPKQDDQIIKLIQNVLSSILINLSNYQKENEPVRSAVDLINIIAELLKDALNI